MEGQWTDKDILDIIKSKIAEIAGIDISEIDSKIALYSNLRTDLGIDSLDLCQLIYSLEEEFCIPIPEEENIAMDTVQNIFDNIKMKL